uniref:DUF834 domain-containing protein n=1 Tax=Oryza rufipogon TaxID=4529 RepID=A0A0E0RCA4_ORYRU
MVERWPADEGGRRHRRFFLPPPAAAQGRDVPTVGEVAEHRVGGSVIRGGGEEENGEKMGKTERLTGDGMDPINPKSKWLSRGKVLQTG